MRRVAALCAGLPGGGQGDRALALLARRSVRLRRVPAAANAGAAARAGGCLCSLLRGARAHAHVCGQSAAPSPVHTLFALLLQCKNCIAAAGLQASRQYWFSSGQPVNLHVVGAHGARLKVHHCKVLDMCGRSRIAGCITQVQPAPGAGQNVHMAYTAFIWVRGCYVTLRRSAY